jgi:hypothetical protein
LKLIRLLVLAGLLVLPLASGSWAQSLDIPGEGLGAGSWPPAPPTPSASTTDTSAPRFRWSPQELQTLRLLPGNDPVAVDDGPPLPDIYVQVAVVTYEQVAYTVYPRHARRSLASRGKSPAAAPRPRPVTRYKTVARRQYKDLNITPLIYKYAAKYQLDPWLVRGVIEVESAFQPYAVSPAGAGGLMQLMPGTARSLGCRDRFDPEANIEAGCRYLRQQLNTFGDHDLAIAAYNAGPGNVKRYGGIPPFAETQNYVVKVRRAWAKKERARAK